MTPSTFQSLSNPDEASIITQTGAPDVLALQTTNIPQVHARLTELRERQDHPTSRPREVWVDLNNCHSFKELRGDVLVRALRMTQFLPIGFVGSAQEVHDIASAAGLSRVDLIDQIPHRESQPQAFKPVPSASNIELEQQKDIAAHLTDRLRRAQEDHQNIASRYDVVSRALSTVRSQRDQFEMDCQVLRDQVVQITEKLDASTHISSETRNTLTQAISDLEFVRAEKEDARRHIQELEEGRVLVERSLQEAQDEVEQLLARVKEFEVSARVSEETVHALHEQISVMQSHTALLVEEVRSREVALEEQVASLQSSNLSLNAQVESLAYALTETQETLLAERSASEALVASRDEVMRQSELSNKMLEDALMRIEEVSAQSESLFASLEQQRAQWDTLNAENDETRSALLNAQSELTKASLSLEDANSRVQNHLVEIERLKKVEITSDERRVALNIAYDEHRRLESELSLARSDLENAEATSLALLEDLVASQDAAASVKRDLTASQSDIKVLSAQRENALEEVARLREDVAAGLDLATEIQKQLDGLNADADLLRSELMSVSNDFTQAQKALLEKSRSYDVLSEIASRQNGEIEERRSAFVQIENDLASARENLTNEQDAHALSRDHLEKASLDAAAAQESSELLRQQLSNIENERSLIATRAKDTENALIASREAEKSARVVIQSLESIQENLSAELESVLQDFNAERETVEVTRKRLSEVEEQLVNAQTNLAFAEESAYVLKKELSFEKEALVKVNQRLTDMMASLASAEENALDLMQQLENEKRAFAEVSQKLFDAESDLASERDNSTVLSEDLAREKGNLAEISQRLIDVESVRDLAVSRNEKISADLAFELNAHTETKKALDTVGDVLAKAENDRFKMMKGLDDAREAYTQEADWHASTQLTLRQTREVLEKIQDDFQVASCKFDTDRTDFERRLALSKAESESLARRLETSLRTSDERITVLSESLKEAETRALELDEVSKNLAARIEEEKASALLKDQELTTLNAEVSKVGADLNEARARSREQEETIIEQSVLITELTEISQAAREDLEQANIVIQDQDGTVSKLTGALEESRKKIQQAEQGLLVERERCEALCQKEASALASVRRQEGEIERQDASIANMSEQLDVARALAKEADASRLSMGEDLALAEASARSERRARAQLETQLVDTQEALAVIKREVALGVGSANKTALHENRVRSGQQIVSRGDMVVTRAVSSGAEIVAEGSVHIYAPMQGRVHAGSAGDLDARIYCMNFAAEIVIIAGRFVVFDSIPKEMIGKPVEIWFDREEDCMQINLLELN